jgi:hypothetical protein
MKYISYLPGDDDTPGDVPKTNTGENLNDEPVHIGL